jgi:hypothetical protein
VEIWHRREISDVMASKSGAVLAADQSENGLARMEREERFMLTMVGLGVAAVLVVLLGVVTYSKMSRGKTEKNELPGSSAENPRKEGRTAGEDD